MSSYQCRFLPNYSLPSLHFYVTRIRFFICSQSCSKTDTANTAVAITATSQRTPSRKPAHQALTFGSQRETYSRFRLSCSAFFWAAGVVFNSNNQLCEAELPFSYSPVVHTYKSLLELSLTSERAPLCEVPLCTISRRLNVVIKEEFVRVRTQPQRIVFFPFMANPHLQEI